MIDCIVCRRTGKYIFTDNSPGRKRVSKPFLGWQGPCPYCTNGKTEVTTPTRFQQYIAAGSGIIIAQGIITVPDFEDAKRWAVALIADPLDKPAGGL